MLNFYFKELVLRDFAFKFLMIARSKKEGEMIRRIIRWFKTGAAPVFNDRSLLQTPSIFQLTYGRGQDSSDYFLPTVNKFNEMRELRNITVDYVQLMDSGLHIKILNQLQLL